MLISRPDFHGAYLRADLETLMGQEALRAAVRDGRFAKFSKGVLLESRRAADFRTRAAGALLLAGEGAALARQSALVLHGCTAARAAPVHVLVACRRGLRNRPGMVVHHGSFGPRDIDLVDGLRTQALDLALADVLCRDDRRTGIACADQALALQSEADLGRFRAAVERRVVLRPDPRGSRQAVALFELATGLAESPAESWTLLSLFDGGLPVPVQQYRILDVSGREVYRLDFAWPELRVAVEYDGYEAHEGRKAADQAREDDLRRRGWIVVRADAADLRDSSRLLAAVQAAFRARGMR
ncbi:DUF559 domain-containing protein [Amycolatopsis palatopharyngis]|uniref:DUF559 domain-containing protein n=1 Tax=Amycolatopsis palatopharyngis TaxID=187982 RepID=UPI000E2646B6|nr:DUF559 domain-containing protein [Amycolatopsis palatopharyngis]